MSSYFEDAIERLGKALNIGTDDAPTRSVEVRIVQGVADWPDEQTDELWAIVDEVGDLDDSAPEGEDWLFSLSSQDADQMVEQLKSRLGQLANPCQIVIEEYVPEHQRKIVHWTRF